MGAKFYVSGMVALLCLTSACSAGHPGTGARSGSPTTASQSQTPPNGHALQLVDALRHIAPPTQSAYRIDYSNLLQGRALFSAPDDPRLYDTIAEHAVPDQLTSSGDFTTRSGISLNTATTAIRITSLGRTDAGFLFGSFDAPGIGAKLASLGYQRHDLAGAEIEWVLPAGHNAIANTTALNTLRVSPDRIVYGSNTADVDASAAPTSPIAADPTVAALADCLGPVAMATIDTSEREVPEKVAAGEVAQATNDLTDNLCVANSNDAQAQAVPQRINHQMQTVYPPYPEISWSELYPQPRIEVLGGNQHMTRFTGHKGVFRRALPIRELTTVYFSTFLGAAPITP